MIPNRSAGQRLECAEEEEGMSCAVRVGEAFAISCAVRVGVALAVRARYLLARDSICRSIGD